MTTAGVDVGGTFTDVVVVHDGRPQAHKVPTTPDDQAEGVRAGLRAVAATAPETVAHGTTIATNAVLERAVARTALVTTDGFGDVLTIARQDRPALYDLRVTRPAHLVGPGEVITVRERVGPDGKPVIPLDTDEVARAVEAVAAHEPESVAVSLLFSYAGSAHEERLAEAIADRLGVPVTRSSALLPEFREYERASTCVLNAAVQPVMSRYLSRLAAELPETTVVVMTSGGGTASADFAAAAPVHTLLSGPAAGVVAAGAVAHSAGHADAVAFDMGGTSTDVCLVRDGRPEISTDGRIAGLPFRTAAVAIHTVGAGGGSLAWLDAGGALRVGPQSAGARPGPAAYGLGGVEPTVTDAHCVLGHLDPERTLGGGALHLDPDAAAAALRRLDADGDLRETALGVLTVARATMARALRRVTTERGVDPRELALVAYGGAGPLHATALARELGCATVVIPPSPGVLSALGLLLAPTRHEASRTVLRPAGSDLAGVWAELEAQARRQLAAAGVRERRIRTTRVADCRYRGQAHELRVTLEAEAEADAETAFHRAHREAYGYAMPDEPVDLVTARVVAEGAPALAGPPTGWDHGADRGRRERRIGTEQGWSTALVIDRAGLRAGETIEGPALVEQPDSTVLLAAGEQAHCDAAGNLVVPALGRAPGSDRAGSG